MDTILLRTITRIALVFLLAASFAAPAIAADADPTAAAQGAAVKWLGEVDAGRYADSWDDAAAYFRTSIAKAAWEASLKAVRAPLGTVRSRSLKTATVRTELPGVPDGEYAVIQYETRFENKAAAVETVTPMKEKDGSWKVSGYFVK